MTIDLFPEKQDAIPRQLEVMHTHVNLAAYTKSVKLGLPRCPHGDTYFVQNTYPLSVHRLLGNFLLMVFNDIS